MWGDIAIAFVLAFITAYMCTPHTIQLAKKLGAVDSPKDKRRINKVVMPRLGGLAVICGFFLSIVFLIVVMSIEKNINLANGGWYKKIGGFLGGAAIIIAVCFYDDVYGAKAIFKLLAQIVAATIVVFCGIRIDKIELLSEQLPQWVYMLITIIWIIGLTNAINLIDGLDGLSTGIAIISCISLLIVFSLNGSALMSIILITALCGSLCGFLPYNFNPARTFIGDTGSNFVGFCLSIISILGVAKTYTALIIVAPIIILALPIFDTACAIMRRLIKGKSIKAVFQPDRGHLHHKMIDAGFTQKQAVIIMYAVTAMLGLLAVVLMESGFWKALAFAAVVGIVIALTYKEYFKQRMIPAHSENYEIKESRREEAVTEETSNKKKKK